MSLLMEALRKAELEKKKAAQRLEQTVEHAQLKEKTGGSPAGQPRPSADITREQPISRLDPTVVRSREEILAATAQLSLEPIAARKAAMPGAAAKHDISEDLTVNVLLDQVVPEATAENPVDQAEPGVEQTLKTPALSMVEELDIGADSPLDESFHDAVIDISRELPGIYDETIQGEPFRTTEPERSYDETLPGVSAAELARDLGEENQPTPVAAQTIFTATATTQATVGYKWPVIIGLSVVVVIALSVIIYQAKTPMVMEIPSDQLAGELDLSRLPVTVDLPPAIPPVTTSEAAEPAPAAPTQDQQSTAAATAAVNPEATAPVTPVAGPAQTKTMVAAAEPATAAPVMEIEPGLIKISRSKAPDGRGLMINDAYSAYKHGDYATAGEKYSEVIKIFPDNRDALLGLGAIAMQEGNTAKVQEIYARLFKLNPTDKFARAVLVNLDVQTDPVSRESALKIMIHDDPDNAFLHFSLGNIYAVQSRWAEAQQAFFDAYRNESTNPDYVLNLAISLDRIGQVKPALDYYHAALQLADEQAVQFDSANILARIQTLTTKNSN